MKILSEACIHSLGFPKAREACLAVLRRVRDPEESIQDLVTKIFHSLWFAPGPQGTSAAAKASLQQRAAQLAAVCTAMYEQGGPAIHLPFPPASPLIQVRSAGPPAVLEQGGHKHRPRPGPRTGSACADAQAARALRHGLSWCAMGVPSIQAAWRPQELARVPKDCPCASAGSPTMRERRSWTGRISASARVAWRQGWQPASSWQQPWSRLCWTRT